MLVTLRYSFDLLSEKYEYETVLAASEMRSGMTNFENYLRYFKHRDLSDSACELLEEIKDNYYTIFKSAHNRLSEYGE
jgi:hypothetical protein